MITGVTVTDEHRPERSCVPLDAASVNAHHGKKPTCCLVG
jgi:hypothetical protein